MRRTARALHLTARPTGSGDLKSSTTAPTYNGSEINKLQAIDPPEVPVEDRVDSPAKIMRELLADGSERLTLPWCNESILVAAPRKDDPLRQHGRKPVASEVSLVRSARRWVFIEQEDY